MNTRDFKLQAKRGTGYIRSVGEFAPGVLSLAQRQSKGPFFWCVKQLEGERKPENKVRIDNPGGSVRLEVSLVDESVDLYNYFLTPDEVVGACQDEITARGVWYCLMAVVTESAEISAETGDSTHILSAVELIKETEKALVKYGYLSAH